MAVGSDKHEKHDTVNNVLKAESSMKPKLSGKLADTFTNVGPNNCCSFSHLHWI